jgi:hypothetical protein
MYSSKRILLIFLALGLVAIGCKYTKSEWSSPDEKINYVDGSGKKQGPWEIYADSILSAKGNYKDDKQDGLWTYWYPNGMLKAEGHYILGSKNGMWVEWYPDGEMMWKGEWKNGHRNIEYSGAKIEVNFIGKEPEENVLIHDSIYHIRIRIMNIPVDHLFVETKKSSISRVDKSDLYTLIPSRDTNLILAIGYIPSFDFKDFRNLVTEIEYKIK